MRWVCLKCRCRYAPGAPCCPQCRSAAHDEEAVPAAAEEDEVPKINRLGVASAGSVTSVRASAILSDTEMREHPGFSGPVTAVEHPADGTLSPAIPAGDPEAGPAESAPADPPAPAARAKATPPPAKAAPPPKKASGG